MNVTTVSGYLMNRFNITEDEARTIQNELNDVRLAEDSINMLYFFCFREKLG